MRNVELLLNGYLWQARGGQSDAIMGRHDGVVARRRAGAREGWSVQKLLGVVSLGAGDRAQLCYRAAQTGDAMAEKVRQMTVREEVRLRLEACLRCGGRVRAGGSSAEGAVRCSAEQTPFRRDGAGNVSASRQEANVRSTLPPLRNS